MNGPLRVVVCYLGHRGSGGPISLHLAEALAAEGATTHLVLSDRLAHVGDALDPARCGEVALHLAPSVHQAAHVLRLSSVRALRSLRRELTAIDADIVIHPMLSPFATGLLAGGLARRSVVGVHDVVPHPGVRNRVLAKWEWATARRAGRLLLFSGWAAENVPPKLSRRPPIVIPHGPLDYYRRVDAGGQTERSDTFRVLVFGRTDQYKDSELLEGVARRCPQVQFVVAGTVAQRTEHSSTPPANVTARAGWVADEHVGALFRACDAVLLPYSSMTQSGVIAVAAAFAKPVVCAAIGAAAEQLGPTAADTLADVVSAESLARRIAELAADSDRAARLGATLAAHHGGPYSWQVAATTLLASVDHTR